MADATKSPAARGLRHIALKARDLAATKRFYMDVLGLEVAFRQHGMLFLSTPGSGDLLNFIASRQRFEVAKGGFDHFGIHVPPREWRGLLARLRKGGVSIRGRRGRAAVYVKDPDGYVLELYRD